LTDDKIKIVAFTSGKGGCGKSTIAVNFAYQVYLASKKVLIVDLDISNRGSTGIFSQWTAPSHDIVTLTKLLRDDDNNKADNIKLLEIKPGFYLIPASSKGEQEWTEPKIRLQDLADTLRKKLLNLASKLEIPLIVLDCFCGIDQLTTAGALVADHTILINEPDLVTFTGSLTLLNHLKNACRKTNRKINTHVIVNKVKSKQSIKELILLYRENLEKEIGEAVLVHIPYNEKIFENFGIYPFISELLPQSLFVKKIELLIYILFKNDAEDLIKSNVKNWSVKKIQRIYLKSEDRSLIDSEYLVLRLVSFPVIIGALTIITLLLYNTTQIRPPFFWISSLIVFLISGFVYYIKLVHPIFLISRLNFTIARFNYRLGIKTPLKVLRTRSLTSTIIPFFGSLACFVTYMFLVFILVLGLYALSRYYFDPSYVLKTQGYNYLYEINNYHNLKDTLNFNAEISNRGRITRTGGKYFEKLLYGNMPYVSLNLPFRKSISLENYTLMGMNVHESLSEKFNNTTLIDCLVPADFLDNNSISNLKFINCSYSNGYRSEPFSDLLERHDSNSFGRIVTSSWYPEINTSVFKDRVISCDSTFFVNTCIQGLPDYYGILFKNCKLENVSFILKENQFIAFINSTIKGNSSITVECTEKELPYHIYFDLKSDIKDLKTSGNERTIQSLNDNYLIEAIFDWYYIIRKIRDYESKLVPLKKEENITDTILLRKDLDKLDLIECYLLTFSRSNFNKADSLLNTQFYSKEKYPQLIGKVLSLQLRTIMDSTVNIDNDLLRLNRDMENITVWYYQNTNLGFDYYWDFDLWNRNIRYISTELTRNQINNLYRIQLAARKLKYPPMKEVGIETTSMQKRSKLFYTDRFYKKMTNRLTRIVSESR